MLEEGQEKGIIVAIMALEELTAIRRRMDGFIEEFESFFGEVLDSWLGDTSYFIPAKQLANKYFI